MSRKQPFRAQALLPRGVEGEGIRWIGQPNPLRAVLANFGIPLFFLPWTGLAAFFAWSAYDGAGIHSGIAWISAGFVVMGLWKVLDPIFTYWHARHSVYALTNERLVIVEPGSELSLRSIYPGGIDSIERTERKDGSGDLKIVTGWTTQEGGDREEQSETLLGIPAVREVERQIRRHLERTA